ncbi:MAG TPA: hypothetical protein VFW96_13730, partial [Thermomicrobiales bacterium]|nr:hypothetical protein [Thermomicrobiales bacterium]
IVRDPAQFYWEDPAERRRCDHCGQPLEGTAIEIREGIIRRAWIYRPGEFDNRVDLYLLPPDGGERSLRPMPEWNDHPMGSAECPDRSEYVAG